MQRMIALRIPATCSWWISILRTRELVRWCTWRVTAPRCSALTAAARCQASTLCLDIPLLEDTDICACRWDQTVQLTVPRCTGLTDDPCAAAWIKPAVRIGESLRRPPSLDEKAATERPPTQAGGETQRMRSLGAGISPPGR